MPNDSPREPARLRSIGFRTSVAVNLVMVAAVAGFIAFDALRETRHHVEEKTAALDVEAMTLHQAVVGLGTDADGVQGLIDRVCERMSETAAPGHHIVVETNGRVFQSRAHRRESDEVAAAIRTAAAAPDRRATHRGADLVAGVHAEAGATVYIAERLDDIRQEVRGQVVVRSVGLLVFGAVLALAINLLIHRIVSRPLRRLVRAIDAVRAGRLGERAGPFGTYELDKLAAAVTEMSRTLADEDDRRKLALAKARQVQQNLLPRTGQVAPGVELAAIHRPAETVAGDFYDVLPLPDGTVVCCVADVVGHGVPAAMVAAVLKVLILDAVEVDPDPGQIVRRVNRRFAAVAPSDCFATLLVVRWCPARQTLSFAGAGHEPGLLLVGSDVSQSLDSTGTMLGVMPDGTWETVAVPAPPGSVLVCLTDGVTEAMDADGTQFGRDRLGEAINGVGAAHPDRIVAAVDGAVRRHLGGLTPADDYTLVAVQFG